MLPSFVTYEDFFPDANELRSGFVAHFSEPHRHRPETHQIWNYWHVPGQYTYLRTQPEKILPRATLDRFFDQLKRLASEKYGLNHVTWPYLSLYVTGCGQGLHNDATNGRFGYVYSLTRWDERKFNGGETLIFHERAYFATSAIVRPGADTSFYDLVPPRFNQLLLFDDRLIHGVPRIEGSMKPEEGRLVLHGHLSEGPGAVAGPLPAAAIQDALAAFVPDLRLLMERMGFGLAGLLTVRLSVAASGKITHLERLYDRLMPTSQGAADPAPLIAAIIDVLQRVSFPESSGPSTITLPIAVDPRVA